MEQDSSTSPEKMIKIQKQWKKDNSPALREDEENQADEKLPTISQLHEILKENTHMILTEIQNSVNTRVKQEQITMKKQQVMSSEILQKN